MTTTFSPGLMCSVMSSSTRWSPKDLDRFLTSITLPQPPFQLALEPGEDHDQDQVHRRRAQVGVGIAVKVLAPTALAAVQQLLAADDGDEGGVLEAG